MNKSPDRSHIVANPSKGRSRVSNGSTPFLDADGRSATARIIRDRERELSGPLGGMESLTATARLHVKSAAFLSVRLETARSALARGDNSISDEDAVRLAGALNRELAALDKIAARSKPAPPNALDAYLAAKAATAEAA